MRADQDENPTMWDYAAEITRGLVGMALVVYAPLVTPVEQSMLLMGVGLLLLRSVRTSTELRRRGT